jgi:electron transfer flavoprotein beta subunit
MNILVVLRAVRDPAGFTVNRKAQKVFVNRDTYIVNPADQNALEAALRLAGEAGSVIALAYGDTQAEAALYLARTRGAARAVWVRAPALKDADAGIVTKVIERAVAHMGGVDVVALGAEVLDADLGQVGARLAKALGWAFLPEAWTLEGGNGTVRAVRRGLGGFRRFEAEGPVVATVTLDSNRPRLAPAARIIGVYAEAQAIEAVEPKELGLDEADLTPSTQVRGEAFPPERTWGQRVEGSVEAAAREMAAALMVR